MKVIQMTIDERLLEALDCAARAEHRSRSEFVRDAMAAQIKRRKYEELVRQDIEGYRLQPQTPEEVAELDEWAAIRDWGMSEAG
jgi:metal-responsive CopG/Arc/MetJ family transcriptional regulator